MSLFICYYMSLCICYYMSLCYYNSHLSFNNTEHFFLSLFTSLSFHYLHIFVKQSPGLSFFISCLFSFICLRLPGSGSGTDLNTWIHNPGFSYESVSIFPPYSLVDICDLYIVYPVTVNKLI